MLKYSKDGVNSRTYTLNNTLSNANFVAEEIVGDSSRLFTKYNDEVFTSTYINNGSNPDGTTWNAIPLPNTVDYFRLYYLNNMLYLKFYIDDNQIIYYTDNLGTTWTELSKNGLSGIEIPTLTSYKGGIAAVTDQGLFILPNGQTTWQKKVNNLDYRAGIGYTAGGSLYYFTLGGFYSSANKGTTWAKVNFAPHKVNNLRLDLPFETDNKLFVVERDTSNKIFSSSDGTTWTKLIIPEKANKSDCYFVGKNSNSIFLGAYDDGTQKKLFYRSTNDGTSWEDVSSKLINLSPGSYNDDRSMWGNGGTLLLSGKGTDRIYKSINNGDSWTSYSQGLILKDHVFALRANIGDNFFLSAFLDTSLKMPRDTIYRRSGNDAEWKKIGAKGLPENFMVQTLSAHNNVLYLGTIQGGIYKSTDLGENWTSIRENLLPEAGAISFSFIGDETYLATWGHSMWKTLPPLPPVITFVPDKTISKKDTLTIQMTLQKGTLDKWSVLSGSGSINSNGQYTFIGTTPGDFVTSIVAKDVNGLSDTISFKIKVEETTGIDKERVAAEKLHIYPNPVLANSTISFYLKNGGFTKISLTDYTGRAVSTIFTGSLHSGNQEIMLQPGPEITRIKGIYFCIVEVNAVKSVKKILIE